MLNAYDVIDTIKMIEEEHLDIRTVTMGISLVDCIRGSIGQTADRIYDKITSRAKNLVPVAESIGKEYGVPIVNKRVSVTPISILGGAVDSEDLTPLALAMQRAAECIVYYDYVRPNGEWWSSAVTVACDEAYEVIAWISQEST